MKFTAAEELHRATTEEIRKSLSSKPTRPWQAPKSSADGVVFDLESKFDLEVLLSSFGHAFPELPETRTSLVQRRARIHSAGGYRSTTSLEEASPSSVLEHADYGAVYLDLKDKSFLHFGSEQLPGTLLSNSVQKLKSEWRVVRAPGELTLSVRGALSLDVRIELDAAQPVVRDVFEVMLHTCLPGLEHLVVMGLPLDELILESLPVCVETWSVGAKGERLSLLASHRVTIRSIGEVQPSAFAIPEGFFDLRAKAEKQSVSWVTLAKYPRRARHSTRARQTSRTASGAQLHAQMVASYGSGPFPRQTDVPSEPAQPHCRPQTLHASASFEIRQSLLVAIQSILNAIGSRLDEVSGVRVNPTDPGSTAVHFDIDWLDKMERYSNSLPQGDELFLLLRNPPDTDGMGGGGGLLDRMAESLARELLLPENPLPFGGSSNPVRLPTAIENEIAAVAADITITRRDRFDALDATTQARVREEVLSQRIASVNFKINGRFGELIFPSPSFDLLHVRLQLESLRAEFAGDRALLRGPLISLIEGDANRPQIEFDIALRRIEAILTMERWPGVHFWATAAGTLVTLAIVGPFVIGPLVLLLMGLGPLGWLALYQLITTSAAAAVLGGAVFVSVLTYLIWDTTELRMTIDQPRLRSSVAPDRRNDPGVLFLDADRASIEGDIAVSVNSQIPSGIHQLFDAIANLAVEAFEEQVRAELERRVVAGLEQAMLRIPHFRAPLPFDAQLDVPVSAQGAANVLVEERMPRHELLQYVVDGRTQQRLAAGVLTRLTYPFTEFSHMVTQVDPDLRAQVSECLQRRVASGEAPRLGYGISQNLLNGNVFAQWLGNRYVVDYDAVSARNALATVAGAIPNLGQLQEPFTAHAWAAAAPQVQVAPRSYLESTERSYLLAYWPDVRLCLGAVSGKPATLELRFAVHSIAHIGFGSAGANAQLSFFSLGSDFLRVLFDHRDTYMRLNPVALQDVHVSGAGFDPVATLAPAQRLAFLDAVQPLMMEAARKLLKIDGMGKLRFVPGSNRVDQQVYDSAVQVDIEPCDTSLVALVAAVGSLELLLSSSLLGG